MSIIRSLQDWLETFDGMDLVIYTDRTEEENSSYAVSPTENSSKRDVCGGYVHTQGYQFLAKEAALNEVDRQGAYEFLDRFTAWIEEQDDAGNYPDLPAPYKVERIEVFNAMLFDLNEDGTGIYYVQLTMKFSKVRNE